MENDIQNTQVQVDFRVPVKTVLKISATIFAVRVVSAVAAIYVKRNVIPAVNRMLDQVEQARKESLNDE